jgi:hypothetical protein
MRSEFTDVEAAMEEAVWLADTHNTSHVMAWEDEKYTVFPKSDLSGEVVLEIFKPVAPTVRCGNCGYVNEEAEAGGIVGRPWGVPRPGQEARGDNL